MARETFYDEIEIEDFTWDAVANVYHYPCPCGDRFEITKSQLRDGDEVARCPSCSLIIRVIYEWDDFEDYDSADEGVEELKAPVVGSEGAKVDGVTQHLNGLNVGMGPVNGAQKHPGFSFVFVTGNANKLKEVKAILASGGSDIDVTNQAVDVPEVQGTTQEVAIAKCKAAAKHLGTACVTEDTALCFEALNDLPGPYIKDFLTKLGHDGLNTLLDGFPTRRAYALCTFAYSPPPIDGSEQEPILFEGKTWGQIVPPRGPTHFGWDAVFEPEESDGKTYAEMDGVAKNAISHRYRALEKLRLYLTE